jgi:DNA-binding transcriptional LysR family regulator
MAATLLARGLKLSHLRLAAQLGRLGSVSDAAGAMRISQPAASRLASEAEAILGAPLYLREGRGIVLTAEGAALA